MRRFRFDLACAAAILAVYCLNRFAGAFDALPWTGFVRFHLNDFLAGALFPAYVNLLALAVRRRPLVSSVLSALVLAAVCAVAWEFVAPLFLPRSTGDWLDVAAYFAGALLYLAVRRLALGRGSVSLW